ncbi:MAG: ABC transporter permease subunit, partial [Candidatus Bathyarchaeia archaeon]
MKRMVNATGLIWPAWLAWLLPLIGAGLTPIFARLGGKVRDYAAVIFSALAAVMAAMLIPYAFTTQQYHNQVEWVTVPGSPILGVIKAGVIVDPLSVILANVVAIVSFLIMVYSLGYMKGEEGLTRYWFFMNLFIGNMLLLVMSDNFVQMLFGWEGVGLCSYALIGFWYRDSKKDWLKCWVGEGREAYPPSHCGMKAFITTRVGDAAMLIGICVGTTAGAVAGQFGGIVDSALMRLTDLFLSLPQLPIFLLVVYLFRDAVKKVLGPELGAFVLIMAVIGCLSWMPVALLVRAQFLSLREKEFVEAARALGVPTARQVVRHILPNAIGPVIVAGSLDVAAAILLEST